MNTITEAEINAGAVYALRHYVGLSYYIHRPDAAPGALAHVSVCSAFVMQIRGVWFLVTAGHVLKVIEEQLAAGYRVTDFRLWDGWQIGAKFRNYVPFNFDTARKHRLFNTPDDGLDYGLINLGPLYVEALRANGIVPVSEAQYEKNWPGEFHGFAMIGTPEQTVSLKLIRNRDTELEQSVYILHLERNDNPPAILKKEHERFYASIVTAEDSESWIAIRGNIAGMSGGPVIAVRKDGAQLSYWIIGIQSGWEENRRVIAASHFQEFARYIAKAMDEAKP